MINTTVLILSFVAGFSLACIILLRDKKKKHFNVKEVTNIIKETSNDKIPDNFSDIDKYINDRRGE